MARHEVHQSLATVKVQGSALPVPLERKVQSVVVEAQRNLPAMCEVELLDDDTLEALDNPLLRPGAALEVSADAASMEPAQRAPGPLFTGEVVAMETSFTDDGGARLVLRGYDKSHRLHRTRRTRTFLNQSDSDVASRIAQGAGLRPRVDVTPGVHEYLCQRNQTDWEFLTERAREIGYELGAGNGSLAFRRAGADPLAGIPQTVTLGADLLTFRARATSAEQAARTTVRDHDPRLKQDVLGTAPMPQEENRPGDPGLAARSVALSFGTSEDVDTNGTFSLPPQAMKRAQARRDHLAGVAFEADGTCYGNPALVPGGKVTIEGIGRRFSGEYVLTTVRHVFNARGEGARAGYVTRFTISGRHDRSLLGLTRLGASAGGPGPSGANLGSPVLAHVTNTNDPNQVGRVKVKLPWLDPGVESHWAPVVSVGAGNQRGWQVIPEVGDLVLVAFEQGDVRRPYVLGGLYNTRDRLPTPAAQALRGGQTNVRVFRTRAGHVLSFDDAANRESITVQSKGGALIRITDAPSELVEIVDKSGQNAVKVDGASKKVTLEAAANLELKAKGKVIIEGQGGLDLKTPAQVNLEGTGGMTVKSTGTLSLEGSTSTLKGTALLTLQGGVVKIN